jgi:hypothetical protein
MVGDRLPQTLIARQLAEMAQMRSRFFSYAFQAALMFVALLLIGLAVSLVSAALLWRTPTRAVARGSTPSTLIHQHRETT